MIRPLEWDSNFFGIRTAKLDATNLSETGMRSQLESITKCGFELIYVFTPHNHEGLKQQILTAGGKLTDEKVTYFTNVTEMTPIHSGFIRSCLGNKMDTELEMLAIESGKYSRFKLDEQIPRKKFEDLYRLWMENSLNASFAEEVFVFEDEGKKLGMVSVDIRQNEGWIGIIAVNDAYRGKSIGKMLMHAAIGFCKDNKVKILNVQTQMANKVSCTFYEKIGFRVKGVEDVYHIWNR